MLEIVPNPLIRVQLRRIAWKTFQVQARGGSLGQILLEQFAPMDCRSIPNDQQLASDLLLQLIEEGDDAPAIEGGFAHLKIQVACRGDGADDRQMIACQFVVQNGRLSFRCPGADYARQRVEAAFIQEEQSSPFLCRLFFSRREAAAPAILGWLLHCAAGRGALVSGGSIRRLGAGGGCTQDGK